MGFRWGRYVCHGVGGKERDLPCKPRVGFQAGTSIQVGTSTNILNAEEQVYDARRNLLDAKLKYLLSRLRLAAEAGTLGDAEIAWANSYLGPTLLL